MIESIKGAKKELVPEWARRRDADLGFWTVDAYTSNEAPPDRIRERIGSFNHYSSCPAIPPPRAAISRVVVT
jgi:hypothetical protein